MPESSRPVPLPIEIEGKGIWFDREFNGDGVEVCVEYDDHSSFGPSTLERYITISREDWQRIVDALLGQPDQEVRCPVQVTDEMVERAAEAQWESLQRRTQATSAHYGTYALPSFAELDAEARKNWLDDTRAALDAALNRGAGERVSAYSPRSRRPPHPVLALDPISAAAWLVACRVAGWVRSPRSRHDSGSGTYHGQEAR